MVGFCFGRVLFICGDLGAGLNVAAVSRCSIDARDRQKPSLRRNVQSSSRLPIEDRRVVQRQEFSVDENRLEGTARNLGGKVQEGVGRVSGNAKTQAEGALNQAAGTAQDLYGQAADAARQTATTFDSWLRGTIETQPYTTAIIALGLGWLLGRMHRPL